MRIFEKMSTMTPPTLMDWPVMLYRPICGTGVGKSTVLQYSRQKVDCLMTQMKDWLASVEIINHLAGMGEPGSG